MTTTESAKSSAAALMCIQLTIKCTDTGRVLEKLGRCCTDNPRRAAGMYDAELARWENRGYCADICWETEMGAL